MAGKRKRQLKPQLPKAVEDTAGSRNKRLSAGSETRKKKSATFHPSSTVKRARILNDETPEVNNNYGDGSGRVLRSSSKNPSRGNQQFTMLTRATPGRTQARTPFRIQVRDLDKIFDPTHTKKAKEDPMFGTYIEQKDSFLKKTWKICNLSTLHNCNLLKCASLKPFESVLRKIIYDDFKGMNLKVNLELRSCFVMNSKHVDALWIEVSSIKRGGDASSDIRVVNYVAWMMRKDGYLQNAQLVNSVWFPIMMYSGSEKVHNGVARWISSAFGACVTEKRLLASNFFWMVGIIGAKPCQKKAHRGQGLVEVRSLLNLPDLYNMPYELRPLITKKPKFKTSLKRQDILSIGDRWIPDPTSIDLQGLQKFTMALYDILETATGISASMMQIESVHLPGCVELWLDGKIKVNCNSSCMSVLEQLMNLFITTFKMESDSKIVSKTPNVAAMRSNNFHHERLTKARRHLPTQPDDDDSD